jgi:hypothetical protein
MPRITCKTVSPGRPLNLVLQNVGTSFATIADAPDFSVPDPNGQFPTRDPLDASRAIRPGEVAFITPLDARNKTTTARWIEVRLLTEAGVAIEAPGRVLVPGNETVRIPVQGRSLMKRTGSAAANGDRLQVRAETANVFDVWVSAEERLSAEHVG